MKQSITYEKVKIIIDYPISLRTGQCVACLRKVSTGEIRVTQNHHTVYKYELTTVKKNPLLALENRLEVCYGDHQIADALRNLILSNPRGGLRPVGRIMQVLKLLPKEQQEQFSKLCEAFLIEKRKKVVIPENRFRY